MALTDDDCWRVVDLSRAASGGDIDLQTELVVAQLKTKRLDEILRFKAWVMERMSAACLPYLLTAVEWIYSVHDRGPVSGDSWEYFRAWLVAQGRQNYEAVLANADVLAELFNGPEAFGDGEPLEYAGNYAYWAAQGGEPDLSVAAYAFRPPVGAAEPDELYDHLEIEHWPAPVPEEQVAPDKLIARFPRIYRRFGEPRFY